MKNLYRSKLLLVSVIALTVLLVALDSFMLRYSPKLFWITLPLLLLSGGIAVGKLLQIRVNEYAYYDRVDKIIDNTNHKALMSFPLPVALVNNDRRILWCNDAFGSCFSVRMTMKAASTASPQSIFQCFPARAWRSIRMADGTASAPVR